MSVNSKPNEIAITRIYDAPIEVVWDAWTDPDQVAQWWGPRGFTLTTHSKDLRPGGHWSYTMHGPDGTDYPNTTQYLEVEEYAKLVYDHGANDDRPPLFRVTVLFSDIEGKTRMDMTMALPTVEQAEQAHEFIKKANGYSTWDRLAEYLAKKADGREQFVINRSFDVPIDQMFDMWTKPEHIAQWLPPAGFTMQFLRDDTETDGSTFYFMTNHKGVDMYGRKRIIEIQKPERLVYTQQFCDENENISRHPLAPTWPETMLTTVAFFAESADRTRITVTWEPYGVATPEEIALFVQSRPGMTQGWTGSFDKLDALLLATN
ncbi:MAG TPA: SRPBCC family protein [Methylophilaceae bacterium]|nr:SRPBCC family protein [Methylophilaceae bacterium]